MGPATISDMARARHPDEFKARIEEHEAYIKANADLGLRTAIIDGARAELANPGPHPDLPQLCADLIAWADGQRPAYTEEVVVALERRFLAALGMDYDNMLAEFRWDFRPGPRLSFDPFKGDKPN